jgi:hypothetical protein
MMLVPRPDCVFVVQEDDSWRAGLVVGSMCDGQREVGGPWYEALVLSMRVSGETAEVLVGFPGWHPGMDRWLPADSKQLAPLGVRSKGQRGTAPLRKEMLAVAGDEALGVLLREVG